MIEGRPKFTPEDFEYYRSQGVQSKASGTDAQGFSQEARDIAYACGVKDLVFLAQRVIDLEHRVSELENAKPPHMRKAERR